MPKLHVSARLIARTTNHSCQTPQFCGTPTLGGAISAALAALDTKLQPSQHPHRPDPAHRRPRGPTPGGERRDPAPPALRPSPAFPLPVLADELVAGHDVAHLVGSPQLDAAAVVLVEVQEVVGLQGRVEELGQAHALGAAQPRLAALPAQQRPHAQPPARPAEEVEQRLPAQPAGVIQQRLLPQPPAASPEQLPVVREEPFQAGPQPPRLRPHPLGRRRLPRLLPAAGVPQTRRSAPHHGDNVVAGPLEVKEPHDGQQVPDVQRVGGGVEAAVSGEGRAARLQQRRQLLLRALRREHLLEEAALALRRQQPPGPPRPPRLLLLLVGSPPERERERRRGRAAQATPQPGRPPAPPP